MSFEQNRGRILGIVAAVGVIVAGGALLVRALNRPKPVEVKVSDRMSTRGGTCPGEGIVVEMKDPYLKGILEPGQKFKVIKNWYACNELKRGDLVFYRFSDSFPPTVRIARAIPGDHFQVRKNPEQKAWNLAVNGEVIMSGDKPYHFGVESVPPPLSLYEAPRKNILGPHEIVMLSNVPPGNGDSGLFGVAQLDDIVGKVEILTGDTSGVAAVDPSSFVTAPSPSIQKPAKR